jgi:hypothetical protein
MNCDFVIYLHIIHKDNNIKLFKNQHTYISSKIVTYMKI